MLKIYPSFFLMLMLGVLLRDTGYMLSVFLSALIHEGGHYAAFVFAKIPIKEFALKFGRLSLTPAKDIPPIKKALIALSGPLASLAFSGVMMLADNIGIFPAFCEGCARVSLIFGLFNLMPILPLDGGRVIEGVLENKGIYISNNLSLILSFAVFVYGVVMLKYEGLNSIIITGIMLTSCNLPIKRKGLKNAYRKNGKAFVQGAKARPLHRRRTKSDSKG